MGLNEHSHEEYSGTVLPHLGYSTPATEAAANWLTSEHNDLQRKVETEELGFPEPLTAAEAGRMGGSARTLAKRLAAQANGKLGGRPKKATTTRVSSRTVAYRDICLNKGTWSTFSPERMTQFQGDIFRYYRHAGFPYYT